MKYLLIIWLLLSYIGVASASDNYYSGMSNVDKETCLKAASIGEAKGRKDRRVGVRDNNGIDFAYSVCSKCGSGVKAEYATCYGNGYDIGYYGR